MKSNLDNFYVRIAFIVLFIVRCLEICNMRVFPVYHQSYVSMTLFAIYNTLSQHVSLALHTIRPQIRPRARIDSIHYHTQVELQESADLFK